MLSVPDFLATLVTEAVVHHLDLIVELPDAPSPRPPAVEVAVSTMDGLLSDEAVRPGDWSDTEHLLKAQRPDPALRPRPAGTRRGRRLVSPARLAPAGSDHSAGSAGLSPLGWAPAGSDRHVDEAGEVELGGDRHRVGRTVPVLGHDEVRFAGPG